MNTWSGYEAHYKSWQSDIKKVTDTTLAMPMKTDQDKTAKIAAFTSVVNRIENEKRTICKVNTLVEWQHFINAYKAQQANCTAMVAGIVTFSLKLQDMTSYFNDEKTLTGLITNQVNANEELTEAKWGAKLTAWQGVREAITKTTPSTAFKPIKAVALEKTEAIVASWQELISAHETKNKAKFTDAQTKLNDSYGALSAIATTSSSAFKGISDWLQTGYTVAFK